MLIEALKIMGTGVGVVFVVLTLFYLSIKALMHFFPTRDDTNKKDAP